jgi:RNA polymerase sigma factor (sigma-70 family)
MLVIRLAGELSRRFRMSRQEQEDAEQEFAMRLWTKKSKYDENHPSRSSYEAYMTRYLEKCSFEVLKAVRPETNLNETGETASETKFAAFESRGATTESIAMLRLLVISAISKFTPDQKELFTRVGLGESIADISSAIGVPPKTVYSRIRAIRRVFHENGINVVNK